MAGFRFGFKIDLAGEGASPPGGWPQVKIVLGREATLLDARADFFEGFFALLTFLYSENVRLSPKLGFLPYPGIGTFIEPDNAG